MNVLTVKAILQSREDEPPDRHDVQQFQRFKSEAAPLHAEFVERLWPFKLD